MLLVSGGRRMKSFGIGILGSGDGGLSNGRAITQLLKKGAAMKATIAAGVVGLEDGEGLMNARALDAIEGVELVALADMDSERRAVAAKEFAHVPIFESIDDIVKNPQVDLVVVATPDHGHLEPTELALAFGKHVFIEKPVAVYEKDLAMFEYLALKYQGYIHFGEKYSYAHPVEAALRRRMELGEFMWGDTLYTMWKCDRIMGGGKWRTESQYNPVAGGLSHNFMAVSLLANSPIAEIQARGGVLTYKELERYGGFDTMIGTLRFANGRYLNWAICLAVSSANSPFAHRTVTHTLQFKNGMLTYAPHPQTDKLLINGLSVSYIPEPEAADWPSYNVGVLYGRMWLDILNSIRSGEKSRHTIAHGLNIADACIQAFHSAHKNGPWQHVGYQWE